MVRAQEDLRRSVDELTRSNAELERYAYIAAHDLREPIRTITSYIQLLRRRLTAAGYLNGEIADLLEYLESGAERMTTVVNDLLSYSRLQTCAAPFEPVDLNTVLATVQKNLARVISETRAEVICETPLPTVIADQGQMVPVVPEPCVQCTPIPAGHAWPHALRYSDIAARGGGLGYRGGRQWYRD